METHRHGSKESSAVGFRRTSRSRPLIADTVRNQSKWLLTLQVANLEESPQGALSATPDFLLPPLCNLAAGGQRIGSGQGDGPGP